MAVINIEYDRTTGKTGIKVDDLNPLEVAKLCVIVINEALNKMHSKIDESKIIKPNIVDIAKCDATKN